MFSQAVADKIFCRPCGAPLQSYGCVCSYCKTQDERLNIKAQFGVSILRPELIINETLRILAS